MGNMVKKVTGVNTPIYPSSTFMVSGARKPTEYFTQGIPDGEFLYQRFGHPNYKDLCVRLACMECGEDALLFASGMAATFALFFATLSIGDHIVVSSRIYGGTRGQIAMLAHKLRLKVSIVDIADLDAVSRACTKKTKVFFAESVSNPEVTVADVASIDRICHSKGKNILLVIDNTFTPLIVRPLTFGADVVMHSLTKYVNGRSDAMGGALVGKRSFIDTLRHPALGEAPLIGGVLDPKVAQEMAERFYQIEDRVEKASERAFQLAQILKRAGFSVHYPMLSLDRCPAGVLCGTGKEQGGGVLSVAFPTEVDGVRFVEAMAAEMFDDPLLGPWSLAYPAVSLGSAHTYVWCTTEARVQGEMKKWPPLPFASVPNGFVRIAVGDARDQAVFLLRFKKVLKGLGIPGSSLIDPMVQS